MLPPRFDRVHVLLAALATVGLVASGTLGVLLVTTPPWVVKDGGHVEPADNVSRLQAHVWSQGGSMLSDVASRCTLDRLPEEDALGTWFTRCADTLQDLRSARKLLSGPPETPWEVVEGINATEDALWAARSAVAGGVLADEDDARREVQPLLDALENLTRVLQSPREGPWPEPAELAGQGTTVRLAAEALGERVRAKAVTTVTARADLVNASLEEDGNGTWVRVETRGAHPPDGPGLAWRLQVCRHPANESESVVCTRHGPFFGSMEAETVVLDDGERTVIRRGPLVTLEHVGNHTVRFTAPNRTSPGDRYGVTVGFGAVGVTATDSCVVHPDPLPTSCRMEIPYDAQRCHQVGWSGCGDAERLRLEVDETAFQEGKLNLIAVLWRDPFTGTMWTSPLEAGVTFHVQVLDAETGEEVSWYGSSFNGTPTYAREDLIEVRDRPWNISYPGGWLVEPNGTYVIHSRFTPCCFGDVPSYLTLLEDDVWGEPVVVRT